MRAEDVARICHEVNRAYCASIGDGSQQPFDQAPDWQKESALQGVRGILEGRITRPEESHESWLAEKVRTGWVFGEVKDPAAKTHPCMVAYAELPPSQRAKDALFFAVVQACQALQPWGGSIQ